MMGQDQGVSDEEVAAVRRGWEAAASLIRRELGIGLAQDANIRTDTANAVIVGMIDAVVHAAIAVHVAKGATVDRAADMVTAAVSKIIGIAAAGIEESQANGAA